MNAPSAPLPPTHADGSAAGAVSTSKKDLRRRILASRTRRANREGAEERRRELGALWRDHGAAMIRDHELTPGIAAAFLPTRTEPVLDPLLAHLVEQGWTVITPITLPHRRLEWASWTPQSEVSISSFGIREPLGPRQGPRAFTAATLRLVPALALDRCGARLGYGGGYFDAALQMAQSRPVLTAGVVFEEEILPPGAVPVEDHDARLPLALTENGVRPAETVTVQHRR